MLGSDGPRPTSSDERPRDNAKACGTKASGPATIGIWRLMKPLHRGKWCDVYAAQPADAAGSPRCDYAVKLIRSTAQEDPEAGQQIRTEATVAAACHHRHLVSVLDAQVSGAKPYIVMPRLHGRTLESAAEKDKQPVPVVLWWARQCAQALACLHAAGWTHGDLKPENVLVDAHGHLTVCDFGLAQRIGTPLDLVGAGRTFRGTPRYAAPERLQATADRVDAAADVYSLGVIIRELTDATMLESIGAVPTLEAMLHDDAGCRPTASELVDQLLQFEIATLHMHIKPDLDGSRKRVA